MPTTARGIWTPSDTDAVDFTTDLATMAGTIDSALELYGNALRGTASQRAAFLSAAVDGMLWQDTDGVRMIWRKDGSAWVPAVWRWRGTTAQMNSFGANAPDGFGWFSTTDNSDYVRLGGEWIGGGWTTIPSLSGTTVSARRTGNLVSIHMDASLTFDNGTTVLVASQIIDQKFRPTNGYQIGQAALQGHSGAAMYVTTGGQIGVYNQSGSSRSGGYASVVYFV